MNDNTELASLKEQLDILSVAKMYGEVKKSGSNYCYKNDKSIVFNPSKQIFSNFNGDITGGSVLDLVCYMEKLNLHDGINRLKELSGVDTYKPTKTRLLERKKKQVKPVNFDNLHKYSERDLQRGKTLKPFTYEEENKTHLMVQSHFKKLFEASIFPLSFKSKFDYLHNKILGYDDFFRCPSIIIRDSTGKIVDKVAYRPKKPDQYDDWSEPKYIHKNANNRGDDFLYPFQSEMEKIIHREKYIIVGEGIKNSLNGLLYSVPFITTGGSSVYADERLIVYIKDLTQQGYGIICMFDGDKAGKNGFNAFQEAMGMNLENYLSFQSNLDFVDYLQEESK